MPLAVLLAAFSCSGEVKSYKVEMLAEYPHNTSAYTQGLFFNDGVLYESAGQYGESAFRVLELSSGSALKKIDFDDRYFLEGSVILDGNLYFLTWKNHEAFVFDADSLTYKKTVRYPREGWGLTTDGRCLIASDGSSHIYFMDGDFNLERKINVTLDGRRVKFLNELEWIDGRIWANVYMTDVIVIINPTSGKVEGVVDCRGLLSDSLRRPETDVLNGIAVDGNGKIYLTGKYWPRMFEIRLEKSK